MTFIKRTLAFCQKFLGRFIETAFYLSGWKLWRMNFFQETFCIAVFGHWAKSSNVLRKVFDTVIETVFFKSGSFFWRENNFFSDSKNLYQFLDDGRKVFRLSAKKFRLHCGNCNRCLHVWQNFLNQINSYLKLINSESFLDCDEQ